MQRSVHCFLLMAACLVLQACEGPVFLISGGELSGSEVDAPETWTFEEVSELAQLETRADDPYSINLVYVQMDGSLYVYAGNTRTTWVEHIEQNPLVRLRVGETIYLTRAERIHDADEIARFADLWASRSVFQRDPLQFEEVWLYRLEAR